MKKLSRFAFLWGFCLATISAAQASADPAHWVGTWMSAQQGKKTSPSVQNVTLREISHVTIGGESIRIHFSNLFGQQPLVVGAVHVANRSFGAEIVPESDRAVTFDGHESATIPMGQELISDPVSLHVSALSDLVISVFLPQVTPLETVHVMARQTTYISAPGNFTVAPFVTAQTSQSWFFLSAIDVVAPETSAAVVTIGDSITDGVASSLNLNHRWPSFLAERVLKQQKVFNSVVDAGIGYNEVLKEQLDASQPSLSALARFDRDVLATEGVKNVIMVEGINDIGLSGPTAPLSVEDLIKGYQQLIEKAHHAKIRMIGGTITPFSGSGYFSPEKEKIRQAVNDWIRTSHAFDAMVDFDEALRDPSRPSELKAVFDSGDHLHPNDSGYAAMADVVDLSELEKINAN